MSKFGVALQLPPTTSLPAPLHPLSAAPSATVGMLNCAKLFRMPQSGTKMLSSSLPVVVLQLALLPVALSHCRLAAWLVGILNNLPHACKFPPRPLHRRVRAASPTWSLSHISHAAAITAAAAHGAVAAAATTCHSCGNVNCLHKWPGHNWRSWLQVKEPSVSAGLKCFINT